MIHADTHVNKEAFSLLAKHFLPQLTKTNFISPTFLIKMHTLLPQQTPAYRHQGPLPVRSCRLFNILQILLVTSR